MVIRERDPGYEERRYRSLGSANGIGRHQWGMGRVSRKVDLHGHSRAG